MFKIVECRAGELEEWVALRCLLWPHHTAQEHRADVNALFRRQEQATAFFARSPEQEAIGFAETSLRRDHVNGCNTSAVAFLEGIFVKPSWRRHGVARLLCAAAESWGAERGCSEFASDALIENPISHRMHAALGFEETRRVVYFRKILSRPE